MQGYVHSGYYGIFRPPYSLTNNENRNSTIYCVSDRLNTILILIPLVPSFYKDAINIIKISTARSIYLIAPDIGISFISDYYNVWYTVSHIYRKVCKIFTKYMPENFTRSDFIADIIRNSNDTISFSASISDIDAGTISITLIKKFINSASPYSCDVILSDTYKKRLFVGEMNNSKAMNLNNNRNEYNEIHMPYIDTTYGGMNYNDTVQKYPAIASKIICSRFGSIEEYEYARSKSVHIGEAFVL